MIILDAPNKSFMTSLSLHEAKWSITLSRKKDESVVSRDGMTNLCLSDGFILLDCLFNTWSNEDFWRLLTFVKMIDNMIKTRIYETR